LTSTYPNIIASKPYNVKYLGENKLVDNSVFICYTMLGSVCLFFNIVGITPTLRVLHSGLLRSRFPLLVINIIRPKHRLVKLDLTFIFMYVIRMTREMILKLRFPDLPKEFYPLYIRLEDKFEEYGISAELTRGTGYGYNTGDYRVCPVHSNKYNIYHLYHDHKVIKEGTANDICDYIKRHT